MSEIPKTYTYIDYSALGSDKTGQIAIDNKFLQQREGYSEPDKDRIISALKDAWERSDIFKEMLDEWFVRDDVDSFIIDYDPIQCHARAGEG